EATSPSALSSPSAARPKAPPPATTRCGCARDGARARRRRPRAPRARRRSAPWATARAPSRAHRAAPAACAGRAGEWRCHRSAVATARRALRLSRGQLLVESIVLFGHAAQGEVFLDVRATGAAHGVGTRRIGEQPIERASQGGGIARRHQETVLPV